MLIVGLGNPDKKYENTYHNVGFMLADSLSTKLGLAFKNKECKSMTAVGYFGGDKVVIAKPQTYMNLSGEAVRELVGKYKSDLSDAIIFFDDIDIPVGTLRMRNDGSGGTHNGMKNIVLLMNSTAIPRIRIGIGKPTPPMQLVDYVLSHISGDNQVAINRCVDSATTIIADYIKHKDKERLLREINALK